MAHAGGRPLLFKSPEELEAKINAYFAECKEQGRPLTVSGLAYSLDIDRRTLVNYSNKDEFFPTIRKARAMVELSLEEKLVSSNGMVTGMIFNLKNNFGWMDKQEIDAKVQTLTPIMGGLAKDDVHSDSDD